VNGNDPEVRTQPQTRSMHVSQSNNSKRLVTYVQQQQVQHPSGPDRSVITAAGGLAALGGGACVERLPSESGKSLTFTTFTYMYGP
jgi:chromatin structure-remodeling complex subunit RSC1/2